MWTTLCMLGLHCTAVSSHPIWVAFAFLRLMWLVLLCILWCAHLREKLYFYFLFIAVFPSSRSCFVNPMKINVLSKGKPQQCLSFLTNSKRSFFTSRLSYVMCAYLWTWCYAAPSRSAFYKYFLSFLHSSPSSSLFHRHVESWNAWRRKPGVSMP